MQNKYVSALGTKYADFGFSKEVFDRVALQRLKTIKNESEIETDIASQETFLLLMKEMQGSIDVLRTKATRAQKELDDFKKKNPETDQTPKEQESEVDKKIQAMMEIITGMKADMDAGKKKAHADAIVAKVHELMKANGCTNDFIRTATLEKVEIGEADTAESIAERCKSLYDSNCKKAFGEGYVPPKGNNHVDNKADYSAMVAALKASGDLPSKN